MSSSRPLLLASLAMAPLAFGACGDKDGGDDFDCDYSGIPNCVEGREWTGPQYCFHEYNFSREADPVENHYFVDSDSFDFVVTDLGLLASQVHDSLDIARSKWNDVGALVEVRHVDADDLAYYTPTGVENIIAAVDGCDIDHDPPWVAYSHCGLDGAGEGLEGCAIVLYSTTRDSSGACVNPISWSVASSESDLAGDEYSVSTAIAHEIGHTLGLDDNGWADSMMNGVLLADEIRTLSGTDGDALLYVYE